MAEAFYLPLGDDRYESTSHTRGPWDPAAQHAGPPSALMARAIEQCQPRHDAMLARVTNEILGPVPVAELVVTASVTRPGRSVELVEATMSAGGRDVMRSRAWRVRRTTAEPSPSPDTAPPPLPDADPDDGSDDPNTYLGSIEWRWARGDFRTRGPAAAWTRMRCPLVPGEEPSPWQRTLIVADSGNGASRVLSGRDWYFINSELSVHLHREPVGEWICLDAATTISPGGVGLATSTLSDLDGPVGRGAQALFVGPRANPAADRTFA